MAQPILDIIGKAFKTHHPESLRFFDLDRDVATEILACLDSPEYDIDESCYR